MSVAVRAWNARAPPVVTWELSGCHRFFRDRMEQPRAYASDAAMHVRAQHSKLTSKSGEHMALLIAS
jgi:hypothetical protein